MCDLSFCTEHKLRYYHGLLTTWDCLSSGSSGLGTPLVVDNRGTWSLVHSMSCFSWPEWKRFGLEWGGSEWGESEGTKTGNLLSKEVRSSRKRDWFDYEPWWKGAVAVKPVVDCFKWRLALQPNGEELDFILGRPDSLYLYCLTGKHILTLDDYILRSAKATSSIKTKNTITLKPQNTV